MRCGDVIDQLPDLLYDELDAPSRRAVEQHILGCPTCNAERESLQRTMQVLDQWAPVASADDPQTIARVAAALGRSRNGGRNIQPTFRRSALTGLAAALVAFVGLSLFRAEIRYGEGGMSVSFGRSETLAPGPEPESPGSEFLLVLYEEPASAAGSTADQGRELADEYTAWAGRMVQAGHAISGEKLMNERGRVLRKRDARVEVRPGEDEVADEFITGYFRLRAESYEEAVELTKSCPHLTYGSRIELRQIDPLDG